VRPSIILHRDRYRRIPKISQISRRVDKKVDKESPASSWMCKL